MLLKLETSQTEFVEHSELLAPGLTKRLLKVSSCIEYKHIKYFGSNYIACPCRVKPKLSGKFILIE